MKAFWRFLFGRRKAESTGFSDFIRKASAGEKKRVYTDVLKRATERQNAVRKSHAKAQEHRQHA
jgi:hypothetical protein